jgi:hypothetical protein
MKKLLAILILTALPLTALAQTGPNVPVIIVENGNQLGVQPAPEIAKPVPGRGFANFPDIAVTRVGENTTGQHIDPPATTSIEAPTAPLAPVPATPASPTPPAAPAAKLWPRDTIALFMPSCMGFYPQFASPCMCVITHMMSAMPHDEFLRESEAGTVEQDQRLITIRTNCASAPKQKQ